jgi:hypothetical protein
LHNDASKLGFKAQVQQNIIQTGLEMVKRSRGKDENKDRFPLSHGSTTTISLIVFM